MRVPSVSFPQLIVLPILILFSLNASAVPSFARQTGQACAACHTSYPELTEFGRSFKANGYTLSDLNKLEADANKSASGVSMDLIPNLSVMAQAGETLMSKAPDGIQNPSANFPKELALFYAGRVAPSIGTFLQLTYDSEGSIGIDTADVRAVSQKSGNTVYGLDINNGPTREDLWNTTPAFGWPYVENDAAVTADGPFIGSDAIQSQVFGIGGYAYWNQTLYGYIGVYQSAKQGDTPTTASGLADAAPYYRLAWTPTHNWEIGTFGFLASYQPDDGASITDPNQAIHDFGVDTQYQIKGDNDNSYTLMASYIRETRDNLNNTVAGYSGKNSVSTDYTMLSGSWLHAYRYGANLGIFCYQGDRSDYYNQQYINDGGAFDDGLGFRANAHPDTRGAVLGFDYLPEQNVRVSLQYTAYNKFHGYSSNYDGSGRDAADNNTLLLNGLISF